MRSSLPSPGAPTRIVPGLAVVVLLVAACAGSPAADSAAAPTTTAAATASFAPAGSTSPATTSLSEETTSSAAGGATARLTIVCDNTAYDRRLTPAWGFAALVEVAGARLLFDTGNDGRVLLGNMALLGIDPSTLDAVVLSHEHADHVGGLGALLDTGATPTVYLPESFSPAFREGVAARTQTVEIAGPREILPGVSSTGEMGRSIVEQALVIATPEGMVLVTGCAHPGIVEMVRRAREMLPGEVALVVGGFHLGQATRPQVESIIAAFRELAVQRVAATHCTGADAAEVFAREYGEDFLTAGAGRVIEAG